MRTLEPGHCYISVGIHTFSSSLEYHVQRKTELYTVKMIFYPGAMAIPKRESRRPDIIRSTLQCHHYFILSDIRSKIVRLGLHNTYSQCFVCYIGLETAGLAYSLPDLS